MLILLICGSAQAKILHLPPSSLSIHSIPAHKHQSIVSLLLDGGSIREVAKKAGVGKSTVGEIRKEIYPTRKT
jgi:DNA invertase Pin-like site-specific DNA recombinase